MESSGFFALFSLLAFLAVLFTPLDSNTWVWFFVLGIVFGILWWFKK